MEAEVREVPTADALLSGVKEGVEEIVRDALNEADRLRERAAATLERYDDLVNESTRLRSEIHGLRRDVAEIPARINKARLDRLVPDGGGEDPHLLQRRYIAARERLPVAQARLSRLDDELASIVSGGSRPSKVDPSGGPRKLVKHEARIPILDGLNETATALERLRDQLPDVVKEATADLLKERDRVRDSQNQLWGMSKA